MYICMYYYIILFEGPFVNMFVVSSVLLSLELLLRLAKAHGLALERTKPQLL